MQPNGIAAKSLHRVLDRKTLDPSVNAVCALAVMTKASRPGYVKTRLVPPLTPDEAAQLNTCFLRDTAAAIAQAAGNLARGISVYTPSGAEGAYIDILPRDFQLLPQRGDQFGERLALATDDLFRIGFESVCLIDSDSPTVPSAIYAQAARLLSIQGDRLVLGPSDDGGYYLIGLKQNHRQLFEGIDWSTDRVLEQTVQRAAELKLPVELLPTGYDVDDRATLKRLCQELLGEEATSTSDIAPETRRFLREIVGREGRDRIWPA